MDNSLMYLRLIQAFLKALSSILLSSCYYINGLFKNILKSVVNIYANDAMVYRFTSNIYQLIYHLSQRKTGLYHSKLVIPLSRP